MTCNAASPGLVLSPTSFSPSFISPQLRHQDRVKRLRRTILNTGNLLQSRIDAPFYRYVMVTLTYAPAYNWQAWHVSGYLKSVRQYLKQKHKITKLHYMWVMELQKKGKPHYHLLLRLPRGIKLPMPDKGYDDQMPMWGLGSCRIEFAKHAVGYLAKYVSKGCDAAADYRKIPRGARLHGASQLDKSETVIRQWWNLPSWVRKTVNTITACSRVTGGYVKKSTGEFLETPYTVRFSASGLVVIPKLAHGSFTYV